MIYFFFSLTLQTLNDDEPERYQSHFSEYIKRGIEADDIEELYKKVHAAIRADPTQKKSEKQPPKEHKRLESFIIYLSSLYQLVETLTCLFFLISFQIQPQEADLRGEEEQVDRAVECFECCCGERR